jgi:hypothetical protein
MGNTDGIWRRQSVIGMWEEKEGKVVTIAQISPAGLSKRTTTAAPAKERTPGPYKSLNNALDLADRIGIKATIEAVMPKH